MRSVITLSEVNYALKTYDACQRFYRAFGFHQSYDYVNTVQWMLDGEGVL